MPHIAFLYAMQVGGELAALEICTDYYSFIMEGIQVIVIRPISGIPFLQQRPQAGSTLVCRVPRDFLTTTRKWRKANTGNESRNKNDHHLAALCCCFRTSRRILSLIRVELDISSMLYEEILFAFPKGIRATFDSLDLQSTKTERKRPKPKGNALFLAGTRKRRDRYRT